MTHVVAEPCFACKYTDCVVVCPVECFYEGDQMLYIHPDECIDCEACVPECPVEAIFHEDNLPEEWKPFTELNAEMSPQLPVITEKKDPNLLEVLCRKTLSTLCKASVQNKKTEPHASSRRGAPFIVEGQPASTLCQRNFSSSRILGCVISR